MKKLIAKGRLALCAVIVIAFFLPSYASYSALSLIPLAWAEAGNSNVTSLDVLMLIGPLVMIPLTAIVLSCLFMLRISVRSIYLALPVVFLVFFFVLLYQSSGMANAGLRKMQVGFYLMVFATSAFPFTKNSLPKKRRRLKRRSTQQTETAA